MTRTLFALVLVAFASLETRAAPRGPESVPDPRPHAFVVDETDVLRLADIDTMNKTARAFSTTGELVVLVLDSIGGASPRPFATAVFNRFRVDRHERNRGVLVMFAIEDRKAEIVLGDGWPATTTILTDRVMQDVVIAQMKAGDPRNAVIGAAQELATVLAGVVQIQRRAHADARGSFSRLFCAEELATVGWSGPVAQVNHSVNTTRGTVRGLHYQRAPWAEQKLVSCVRGRVWDVAVDLRRDSPTFLLWHAQELSAQSGDALLIPEGCAHGYQALSDDAEIVYCHSSSFAPQAQAGAHPCDPRLAIVWPLPVERMSQRDAEWPMLAAEFAGVDP